MAVWQRLTDQLRPAWRAGLWRCCHRARRILANRVLNPHWLGPRLQTAHFQTQQEPLTPALEQTLRLIAAQRAGAHKTDHWDRDQNLCCLLNQPGFPLLTNPSGQPAPCPDPLWLTRLHEFDWAWPLVLEAQPLRQLVETWWQAHPLGRTFGWNPYATSRRLIVWSIAARLHDWTELHPLMCKTAAFLAHNLEQDLDNNHLFANYKALVLFDLLYPTARAPGAQNSARESFFACLARHVLPDGGHFERSSSYHLATWLDALETLLILEASDHELPAQARTIVAKLERFACALRTPAGQLPLWGDAVVGEPMAIEALLELARRLTPEPPPVSPSSQIFAETGYAVLRRAKTTVFFDCGDLGPDHCPGHGHADMLAVELWHDCNPVWIDCGTYQYQAGAKRDAYRGTLAHNTAAVDDSDQVRFVGPFRIAELGHAKILEYAFTENRDTITAEHDGYRRLATTVTHRRQVNLTADGQLSLTDSFEGAGTFHVTLSFHYAPGCKVALEGQQIRIDLADGQRLTQAVQGAGHLELTSGFLSESWFREQTIPVVRFRARVQDRAVFTTQLTA